MFLFLWLCSRLLRQEDAASALIHRSSHEQEVGISQEHKAELAYRSLRWWCSAAVTAARYPAATRRTMWLLMHTHRHMHCSCWVVLMKDMQKTVFQAHFFNAWSSEFLHKRLFVHFRFINFIIDGLPLTPHLRYLFFLLNIYLKEYFFQSKGSP